MTGELDSASRQLYTALGRYMQVSGSIEKSIAAGQANKEDSRELLLRVSGEVDITLKSFTNMFEFSKSALARARNISALTPVNRLPAEALSHIFRMVVAGESCFEECDYEYSYSKYPEHLAHVCSRWRRIAIDAQDLWVHIDLAPHHFYNNRFLPRANAYYERSGDLPLYIHLHGSEGIEPESLQDLRSVEFIASIAPRIGGLYINMNLKYAKIFFSAMQECFNGCTPGIFNSVVIRRGVAREEDFGFVVPTHQEHKWTGNFRTTKLHVSEQRLTDVLLGCTSLSLDGLLFPWTSRAYQGLVELRLTVPEHYRGSIPILPRHLTTILKSNPQLRILDFRLYFECERASSDIHLEPIDLAELEWLSTGGKDMATFLRFIALSSKPLDVTLNFPFGEDILKGDSQGHIPEFFSQANVRRLWVSGAKNMSDIPRLLQFAPEVRELVLEYDCFRQMDGEKLDDLGRGLSLDVVYLFGSVGFRDMLNLLREVKVRSLICWKFALMLSDDHPDDIFYVKPMKEWFSELCPEVKVLDATQCPCPISRWA